MQQVKGQISLSESLSVDIFLFREWLSVSARDNEIVTDERTTMFEDARLL